MRVVVNEFMSLDGVVQAPGGAEEDTDGGFANGGWSMPYFDPEVMGAAIGEGMITAEVLLFGRRPMKLVKCVTAGTGVQVCTFHPAHGSASRHRPQKRGWPTRSVSGNLIR